MQDTSLSIGDWVHVKLRWRNKPVQGVSVMAGTIIAEDDRTMGFQQFKLDNGMWFSPQSDQVLDHKPKEKGQKTLDVYGT